MRKSYKYLTFQIFLIIGISILSQSVLGLDENISANYTSTDHEYLFFMHQYWIPDLYEIKGKIDGAYSHDIIEIQNMSLDYSRLRLDKNLNESNSYNISGDLAELRFGYAESVNRTLASLEAIQKLNRSDSSFPNLVSLQTAPISLYGSWLEYQVMKKYQTPGRSLPDIASLQAGQFFQIMDNLTNTTPR